MIKISTVSLGCLWGALALGSGGLLGCSGKEAPGEPSSVIERSGTLGLSLTTRGASGALYRLREATFFVTEQSNDPFGGLSTFLFSENDPSSSTLETTLTVGEYSVELFSGWVLEKVENGAVSRVQANLVSSPLQFVGIQADEETFVTYRFQTGGEIIEFGQGRLVIDIEVEENAPIRLGEPLEIVDGVIDRSSNAHGIQAELFSATSPRAATLEVTEDTGALCVTGLLDVVQDDDFTTQWGALFGFSFLSEELEAQPWDLDGGRVTGFAFIVSGAELPPLRFAALPGDADPAVDNFCVPFFTSSGQRQELALSSLSRDCWEPGGQPLSASDLQSIAWNLPTDTSVAHPFDFCIEEIRPILR